MIDNVLFSYCDRNAQNALMQAAKKNYVAEHHNRSICQLSKGRKAGKWKTYVYVNSKRKEILKDSEEDIIDCLYAFYRDQEDPTLEMVFDELMENDSLTKTYKTIQDTRFKFKKISPLNIKLITDIHEDDIMSWAKRYLGTVPKKNMFKRVVQLLKRIFKFALKKHYISSDPTLALDARDFYSKCDCTKKTDEERSFSEIEVEMLQDNILKTRITGASLAALLASETAMRMGELLGLHKEDVEGNYIHVHRQYVLDGELTEKPYTKNERLNPNDGRLIPITDMARRAIELALELPGESVYLFHDKAGNPIKPRAYMQNLSRRCSKLGINVTNNHAFRVQYNSRLNRLGLSPTDRALVLGHTVETNERFYSVSDKRRIDVIADAITEKSKGSSKARIMPSFKEYKFKKRGRH